MQATPTEDIPNHADIALVPRDASLQRTTLWLSPPRAGGRTHPSAAKRTVEARPPPPLDP